MQRILTSRISSLAAVAAAAALAGSASAQITISTSTTAFTDISATGTSPGTASDDVELNVPAASLTAAGFTGNQLLGAVNIRIGNNGSVLWNSTAGEVGYINSTVLPTMAAANLTTTGNGGLTAGTQMVCALWDDNTPQTGQTANALDWQVIGGNLIIQWSNEDHFNAVGTGTVQYQMVVYGGGRTIASGLPLVDFVYNDTNYNGTAYQDDGGSATIGYKNWGVIATANDVEYGVGGGTDTIGDPAFGGTNMQPKVAGYASSVNPALPHALVIKGAIVAPLSYCTAGTTTNGCLATVSATANPSLSSSVCTLTVSNIEGLQSGVMFYGLGQATVPWGTGSNSFLCVKSPLLRAPVQNSGGTFGACDGTFTLNWDAFQAATPGALGQPWSAGNKFNVQGWFRDPPAPKTTNLSDALELTYQP